MSMFIGPELQELIKARNWPRIRELMAGWHIPEISDVLAELDNTGRALLFRSLPRETAAEVFSYLDFPEQESLLQDLTAEETRNLIADLAPDDRAELLGELPAEVTPRLLSLLSPEDLKETREILGYPEESVGRLMTPDYVRIRPEWTVRQALDHVRKTGEDSETMASVYVVDSALKLTGVVSLRQLVLGDPDWEVSQIMRSPAISLSAFDDHETAATVMERYDASVLPVLDSRGALVGIVTSDDVFEAAQDATTEDFHKGAAVAPLKVGLKDASAGLLYRNRIKWLLGLVLVYLASGGIMARFDEVMSSTISLVFFLPLLIDSAGNAGSQSAVLVVRALAMEEIDLQDWARVVLRELGVAIVLGLAMGLTILAVGVGKTGLDIAFVVALTMVINVVLMCVVGACTPLLISKLGHDPAVASSPLVTSIADILGVLIYFSIATWYLRI